MIINDIEIKDLLHAETRPAIVEEMKRMPTVEVAEILAELETEDIVNILALFEPDQQGVIVSDFSLELQKELFEEMEIHHFASLFNQMYSDVRADFYQALKPEDQVMLLPYLSKSVRNDVIQLSAYPPETAGGVMNTDYSTVTENMTAREALAKIREDAPSKKMIYYIYVVDRNRKLLGFITLKNLIMADPDEKISSFLNEDFVYSEVSEDREIAARKIEKYDLVAIPVVNHRHQLVGILNHDDALEVIRSEHTEDMEKFMGIMPAGDELDYMHTSSLGHFKKRIVWLSSLAILGLISGIILHQFEETLEAMVILALYIPMMADSGGNTGSQAATVVIRALALGQITVKNWTSIVLKEFKVSLLLAVVLGILALGKVFLLSWSATLPVGHTLLQLGMVISGALAIQIVTATIIGGTLPLIVRAFGGDPAVAASPAITTIVDITGLLIYFGIAILFLNV